MTRRLTLKEKVENALAEIYLQREPELADGIRQLVLLGQTEKEIHAWAKHLIGEKITPEGIRSVARYYIRKKSN